MTPRESGRDERREEVPDRVLRGLIRGGAEEGCFFFMAQDESSRWMVLELPLDAVTEHREVESVDGEPVYEISVRSDTRVRMKPYVNGPTISIGGVQSPFADQAQYGVPFVLATPHHAEEIRNPENMGGIQPMDPWRGPGTPI